MRAAESFTHEDVCSRTVSAAELRKGKVVLQ